MTAKNHHHKPTHKEPAASTGKDVLYIDADDEITGIIDAVQASKQKIVALVLPKRATALQSIVNMKLLKRAAEHAKKHLVLITSEPGLLPLAGAVGLHVAKSLQSKPEIPDAPRHQVAQPAKASHQPSDESETDEDAELDNSKTIGELDDTESDDVISMDGPDLEEAAKSSAGIGGKTSKKPKFKIPNFNRFRTILLAGGGGLVLLVAAIIYSVVVLPKAEVTIKTDSTSAVLTFDFTLKTGETQELNVDERIVPAQEQRVEKASEQTVPATGEQNNGKKASGEVTLSLSDCSKSEVTVPAGTGVATDGKTYITQKSVTLESVKVGNQCKNNSFPDFSTADVSVTAQRGGSDHNVGSSSFTVAGFSNVKGSSSSAMSGGTDDIIKILSQADIDSAKEKLSLEDSSQIVKELSQALESRGLLVIAETFMPSDAKLTQSANVGDQVEEVTVKQKQTFTIWGVNEDDLKKLVTQEAKGKVDETKQSISDFGFDKAVFNIPSQTENEAGVSIQTIVVAGPELDVDAIKQQIAGKKANQVRELIGSNPGVTDVTVDYSPFWVSSIPKKADKVTVIIEEPDAPDDEQIAT